MLARVDPREQEARTALRGWLARARTYARTNIRQMVIFGAVGFAVAWVLNVWIMASVYDGFRTPTGSPATGTGNFFQGTLFYFFASALISSAISYRLLVGSERFWREIYGVPSSIKAAFTSDSDATLVHALVGFSSATLIVLFVGPSAAAALAFGALLVFTPVLRPIVTGLLLTVYRWIVGRVAPKRTQMPPTVSMLVGVSGSIAAFGIGGILPTTSTVVVGLVAVVAAVIIAQRNKPKAPPTSMLLLALGGGVLAYWLGDVAIALADDGGMRECGNPGWSEWWSNCTGSDTVRDRAWIGGTGAGIGAVTGAALGGSADTATEGGPASDGGGSSGGGRPEEDEPPTRFADLLPGQQRALLTEAMRRQDPSLTAKQISARVDEMLGEQEQPGELFRTLVEGIEHDLETGEWVDNLASGAKAVGDELDFLLSADFGKAFAKELYEDWISGRMQDRVVQTMVEMDKGTTKAGADFVNMLTNSPELVGQGMEFLATASTDDLLALALDSGIEMTGSAVDDMKGKLSDLQAASLSGDDDKVAAIIGELSGTAQFDAMLGMGVLKVVEVRGTRTRVDTDGPPRRRGDGDGGDGGGGGDNGSGGSDGPPSGRGPELDNQGPTRRPSNEEVTVRQLEQDFGYEDFTAQHLDAKAKEHGVIIEMKPANPDSLELIKRGDALGKPELLKPKTTNRLDLELGAPEGSEGLVSFFEPKPPDADALRRLGVDAESFDSLPANHPVKERFQVREEQWQKYQSDMAELQKPPSERSPKFQEAVRRQYGTDLPLEIEIRDGLIFDKTTGKPFTGDYDVWGFRDANTGEYVSPARAEQIYDDLGYAANPQHGPGTAHWQPDDPYLQKLKEGLEWEHNVDNPNGANLLRFEGDGTGLPKTGWIEPSE